MTAQLPGDSQGEQTHSLGDYNQINSSQRSANIANNESQERNAPTTTNLAKNSDDQHLNVGNATDSSGQFSTQSKQEQYLELKERIKQVPYTSAIEAFSNLLDFEKIRSPFEMIEAVVNLGKAIEACINSFWDGITIVRPEKLVIDGDNFLMLYLYVILRVRIPTLFAYVKMMEEFSTSHVRSQSRFGYCMSTL